MEDRILREDSLENNARSVLLVANEQGFGGGGGASQGENGGGGGAGDSEGEGGGTINTVITINEDDFVGIKPIDAGTSLKNILSTAFFWIAALSIIMVIVGGIIYAASSSDETRVRRAKATIQYAIIGLVVSLFAWAIVNWVVGEV
ncbi:MAG: hypothetical protein ACOX0Z_01260 [Candidatus Nanosyncoccaceae bacterium]|jgi:hypothetical protein